MSLKTTNIEPGTKECIMLTREMLTMFQDNEVCLDKSRSKDICDTDRLLNFIYVCLCGMCAT